MRKFFHVIIISAIVIAVSAFVSIYESTKSNMQTSQAETAPSKDTYESVSTPLPQTSVLQKNFVEGNVPLGIKTRTPGPNCYIKVVSTEDNSPILTAFIRHGEALNLKIPAGTYKVLYALGTTWYGEEALFGQASGRLEAMDPLEFKETPEGFSGHSIEWFLQAPRDVEVAQDRQTDTDV